MALADEPAKAGPKTPPATQPAAKEKPPVGKPPVGKPPVGPAVQLPAQPEKAPAPPPPAPPPPATPPPATPPPATPPPATPPREPLPSLPATTGPAAEKSLVAPSDSYLGGSQAELTFKRPLSYAAVEQLITSALEASKDVIKVDPKSVGFQLSNPNPKYTEGDRTAYGQWGLKLALSPEKAKAVLDGLGKQIGENPLFPASNTIGSVVAGNTRVVAVYALVASWVGIIIYLWVRFQAVAFGFAAVVALIHDVFVMLGAVAISIYIAPFLGFLMIEPVKVNVTIVAAFLTIIGYSVNDTIVVFDRIREVRGKDPSLTRKMVNDSTNQTLSRTLLTSLTVFLVVIVLYLFAGDALHGFAFALIVGVATGTYSSIYVAAPILLWLVGKHKGHSV